MKTFSRIWLDRDNKASLQEQVARQIKDLIRRGAVHPHDTLPSTRELAAQLCVSRNTVVYAYDRLISEGYVESRARSGVFVCSLVTLPQQNPRERNVRSSKSLNPDIPSSSHALRDPVPFRPCQPDVSLFPLLMWNRLRGRAIRHYGSDLLHYQASCIAGFPPLRRNLAQYLRASRGVQCDWRQIVITSGSQQALYLLAKLLIPEHGTRAYMEDPGYLGARLAWENADARIIPGALDSEGLKVPTSEVRGLAAIYTTPSRQFPTGVSLSLSRRLAILDYAARNRAWVIEDDYDAEFRYKASPVPSLQSLDVNGRVIYVGTFSKALFPSLRVGYAVVPSPLLQKFQANKHLIDDHGPLIDQATLSLLLESGIFHTHIRRCRKAYAERQATFLEVAQSSGLPLEFRNTDGGMNLLGWLPTGTNDRSLSRRLREAGLDIPSVSSFSLKDKRPGLVFGFTAFSPDRIRNAFEEFAAVARVHLPG